MPAIKYKVELTPSQRSDLIEVSRRGKPLARTVKRALALLKADEGLSDREAAEAVSVSVSPERGDASMRDSKPPSTTGRGRAGSAS